MNRGLGRMCILLGAVWALLWGVFPAQASFLVRADDQPWDTAITLTFMGDCVLGSEEKSRSLPESFDSVIGDKGFEWPFSGVLHILERDDLSVINLEGVWKDDARNRSPGKQHWFRGPTDFAGMLPAGSIEAAGLANNHTRDYGRQGHDSTRQALEAAGVDYFGYGDLWTWSKNDVTIGFGGIRETTWRQHRQRPQREIAQLREMGANYIVYTIHAGKEYDNHHHQLQTDMARAIIDAGADLVVGCHPHVPQGMERYKNGLVFYSLGNFVFGGNLALTEFEAVMAQVTLGFVDQQWAETQVRLMPVFTTGAMPANDFRPILAQGKDKARILERLQQDSPDLEVREVMTFWPQAQPEQ